MKERIYGYFTKGETEGEYEVTVVLPTAYAEFFGVESQWELVLEGDNQDLRWAAVQEIEEQAEEDTVGELYDSFCAYLEDEANWEGDVTEGVVYEGIEAVQRVLMGMGMGAWLQ